MEQANTGKVIYWDTFQNREDEWLLGATDEGLTSLSICGESFEDFSASLKSRFGPNINLVKDSEKLSEVHKQLFEYFAGERQKFELPLDLTGRDEIFQKIVWTALQNIKFGVTTTYVDIARAGGYDGAFAGAVGVVCQNNPLHIVIPCHRVTCKNGEFTGSLEEVYTQTRLLLHEKRVKAKA